MSYWIHNKVYSQDNFIMDTLTCFLRSSRERLKEGLKDKNH